jgi:hypothetical protein
LLLNRLIIV